MNEKNQVVAKIDQLGIPVDFERQYCIFIGYDSPFDWAFCFQLALDLKDIGLNVSVINVCKKPTSVLKRRFRRIRLKSLTYSWTCEPILKRHGVSVLNFEGASPDVYFHLAKQIVASADFDFKSGYGKLIYPTLVDTFKTLKSPKFTVDQVLAELTEVLEVEDFLSGLSIDPDAMCIILNGRITRYRAIRNILESRINSLYYLEVGSTPGHYQLFSKPPQSELENYKQAKALWENAGQEKVEIAKEYFSVRRSYDPLAGISWVSKMVPNSLPKIDGKKKVCTFYSSSQIEFVEDIDPREFGDFMDQGEALASLLAILPNDEWQVFLRKHPNRSDGGYFDEEDEIWAKCLDYDNLRIIEQDSSIDSFSLAQKSDLIVNFGTSFGAECIYWGLGPVLNLRPTFWTPFVPENSPRNNEQLKNLIESGNISKSSAEAILPWGYYSATRGHKMKSIDWNANDGWKVMYKRLKQS
jgi:hypothetical protein